MSITINTVEEHFGLPINKSLSTSEQFRLGTNGKIAVERRGEKAGVWMDFSTDTGGIINPKKKMAAEDRERARALDIIVNKYVYSNEAGVPLYRVVRKFGHKFSQQPFVNGKFVAGAKLGDVRRVPYRLMELLAADVVVFCEGEKDADNVHKLTGLASTCMSEGAGSKNYLDAVKYFAGKTVFVCVDNDEQGIAFGKRVVNALTEVAKSVRYCPIASELGDGADVSDWLEANDPNDLLSALQGYDEAQLDIYPLVEATSLSEVTTADDFVEDLLVSGAMSVVYGPSNVGKTFFVLDLALHVALGRSWREKVVEQGSVLYLAMEGARGISNRIIAFKKHYQIEDTIPLSIVPVVVPMLNDEEALQKLIVTARAVQRRHGELKLIVVDTLSRAMAGGDENGPKDMTAFVRAVDELRQEIDAHVLIVHHSGKDEARGARGHSSLRAATDTEIEISGNAGMAHARVAKQRELEIGGEYGFQLETVKLGVDQRGKEITSCVVDALESGGRRRRKDPGGAQQTILLKGLRNALASEHSFLRGTIVCVDEQYWRNEAYKLMAGDKKHRSSHFNRAADSLVATERVGRNHNLVWEIV
tara:strand:- start:4330 stop:6096 length:1767 start_codon:yes stop_codon:yes gene_type:complete